MFEKLNRRFTNDYNEVSLFYVTFNLNKYKATGAKGSCDLMLHPSISVKDEYIRNTLNDIIDYIRDNYDMEELSK